MAKDAITAAGDYVTSEGRPATGRTKTLYVDSQGDTITGGHNTRAQAEGSSRSSRSSGRRTSGAAAAGAFAGSAARAPGRASRGVTAGKSALAAELLLGYGIVLIRVVGDFEIQNDGSVKGKVGHPAGQYGPFPIAIGLTLAFFLLSFLARFGGAKATIANILGGIIVLTLAMKSSTEIMTVGAVFTNIGKITEPAPTGSESSGASNTNSAPSTTSSPTGTGTSKTGTGTSTGTAKPTTTTPVTNSLGAAARRLENLGDNFGVDLLKSFDLANPKEIVQATSQEWNDVIDAANDTANAATDAGNIGAQKVYGWLKSTFGL